MELRKELHGPNGYPPWGSFCLPQLITESGADLVALGTHGAAGADAFWSGSLGQKLLDRVPASFLLVPVHSEEE